MASKNNTFYIRTWRVSPKSSTWVCTLQVFKSKARFFLCFKGCQGCVYVCVCGHRIWNAAPSFILIFMVGTLSLLPLLCDLGQVTQPLWVSISSPAKWGSWYPLISQRCGTVTWDDVCQMIAIVNILRLSGLSWFPSLPMSQKNKKKLQEIKLYLPKIPQTAGIRPPHFPDSKVCGFFF